MMASAPRRAGEVGGGSYAEQRGCGVGGVKASEGAERRRPLRHTGQAWGCGWRASPSHAGPPPATSRKKAASHAGVAAQAAMPVGRGPRRLPCLGCLTALFQNPNH
jgi:hypothetical protein